MRESNKVAAGTRVPLKTGVPPTTSGSQLITSRSVSRFRVLPGVVLILLPPPYTMPPSCVLYHTTLGREDSCNAMPPAQVPEQVVERVAVDVLRVDQDVPLAWQA